MSCGDPHETSCSEVLDRVYMYLDGEIDKISHDQVKVHLEECGPCLREYGLEEAVKRLVHRHCGHDPVPDGLREKILSRIEAVRAQLDSTDELAGPGLGGPGLPGLAGPGLAGPA